MSQMSQDNTQTHRALQKSTFAELRQSTFRLMIIFVGLSTATLLWLTNVQSRTSPPSVVVLWLAVELVCAASWWVHSRNLYLATWGMVAGLWFCNAAALQLFHLDHFVYFFALLVLVAAASVGRTASIVFSALSTVYLIWVRGLTSDVLIFISLIWITYAIGMIAFYSLYKSLGMAWSYQDYAISQMREARDHRGNLMKLTKALNEVREDLERANTQLIHANRAADEARRLKAQFAANVSHELRTPINLIVGFSETIVLSPESYGAPLPPVYWADLNTIYRSAKHLQSLINDVLDMSQLEVGKLAIVKEEIEARQVITEAANLARDMIESRGLSFVVHLPHALPVMYLDRTRIRQVILNLLSNAARFTPSGTITLAARVVESQLEVDVQDTGIGIPPVELDRVFEEFYQTEGSLSRKRGGSGLGLTLSKQFVELHGGRIWAKSEGISGKGSTFTFTLPVLDHRAAQLPVFPMALSVPNQPEKDQARYFIVYDDDPAILQLFIRHTVKHKVVGADSQEEALRLVDRIRPAALVLDERNDESELHQRLRQDNTPVIVCAMPSTRRALHLGSNVQLINEPVTSDSLREALAQLHHPKNVLLISDDRDFIRMLSRLLQMIAYPLNVLKAYSAEEGLELARQQPPDVIIVDSMPPKNGDLPVLQHLQNDPALHTLPVLLVDSEHGDQLRPAPEGKIAVHRAEGFQPIELVRFIEAMVDTFTPASVPSVLEMPLDSAAS